jgi:hypothetical protein
MAYSLSNETLELIISEIGEAYQRTRFDWTGFITQVRLKSGNHTFCVPESNISGQGTGGIGICNEFSNLIGSSYANTAPGAKYPKIGVGLITRPDASPFNFNNQYPLSPFPVFVEQIGQSIRFVSNPLACNGISVRLEKKITLQDSAFTIDYHLENVGSETIETSEYVHNFISIDYYQTGPDYSLHFPFPVTLYDTRPGITASLLEISGNEICWNRIPEEPFYTRISGFQDQKLPYFWELVHTPSRTVMKEKGDFPISMIALWGEEHVVSVEIFIKIILKPLESMKWSRTFEFFSTAGTSLK